MTSQLLKAALSRGEEVRDNLLLGAYPRLTGARERGDVEADVERMFDLFPRLRERSDQLAGTLSGGEQQMLAMLRNDPAVRDAYLGGSH